MSIRHIGKLCAALLAVTMSAGVARAGAGSDCAQAQDVSRQVIACTDYLNGAPLDAQQRAAAYTRRGDAFRRQRRAKQAAADFDQAIALDPRYWQAWQARAILNELLARGAGDMVRYEKAAADFDRAIELVGATTAAGRASALARTVARWGNHRDCDQTQDARRRIEGCTRLIDDEPGASFAYVNRGEAHEDLKEDEQALSDFSQAIALDASECAAYIDRGLLHARQGHYAAAAQDFTSAAELVVAAAHQNGAAGEPDFAKFLRDQAVDMSDRLLDEHWLAYLEEIRGEHPNWPEDPYKLYRDRHTVSAY